MLEKDVIKATLQTTPTPIQCNRWTHDHIRHPAKSKPKQRQKIHRRKNRRRQTRSINCAIKHGIFAQQLLLSDENPEDYQFLLDGLQTELKPVGTLELSLVERIAVSLWRQRRLIRSETAHIELSNKPGTIASAVNAEMNLQSSGQEISKHDLTEFNQEHLQWCQSIYEEFKAIADDERAIKRLTNMGFLKKHGPAIYKDLQQTADEDGQTINEFLKQYNNPIDYFTGLIEFCEDEHNRLNNAP